jgi:glycosyltransferase involved in cell wall biosynthesis
MKIFFCIDSPGFGGSEINAMKLITNVLAEHRLTVVTNHVVASQLSSFLTANAIPTIRSYVPAALPNFLRGLRTASRLVRSSDADLFIVWCHHLNSNRWLQLSLALLRRRFIVVEQLLPTDYSSLRNSKATRPFKRFVTRRATRNIVCAYSQRDNYSAIFRAKNVDVIPNTRPVNRISAEAEKRKVKEMDSTKITLACVGRLTQQKNQRLIIDAAALLHSTRPARVLLVGEGEDREMLERIARERNVEISVTGHTNDVLQHLCNADIFVLPSLDEGLPGALIEAMAARLPCIATDIPGNNELIIDKRTGLLISPYSAESLADAVRFMIEHPDTKNTMVEAAFSHVLSNYDEVVEMSKWRDLLASVCKN